MQAPGGGEEGAAAPVEAIAFDGGAGLDHERLRRAGPPEDRAAPERIRGKQDEALILRIDGAVAGIDAGGDPEQLVAGMLTQTGRNVVNSLYTWATAGVSLAPLLPEHHTDTRDQLIRKMIRLERSDDLSAVERELAKQPVRPEPSLSRSLNAQTDGVVWAQFINRMSPREFSTHFGMDRAIFERLLRTVKVELSPGFKSNRNALGPRQKLLTFLVCARGSESRACSNAVLAVHM